jgi:hypothetical protein
VLPFVWLSSLGFARVCFWSNSQSSLRCSEGGFGLWLGDKGIVNGKTSTHPSYSNKEILQSFYFINQEKIVQWHQESREKMGENEREMGEILA